jgi:AcrR family transcriptional regulator
MAYRETERMRQRKEGVRREIVDTARRLVSHGGFRAAQMTAVAAGAGIATGTVYRYFPTQAELFAELFRIASQQEVDAMAAAARGSDSPVAGLRQALHRFTERALRNRRLAYALIAEPVGPLVEAERLKYRRAYAQVVEKLLREGQAQGLFAAQDAQLSAAAVVGALGEALLGPLVRPAASARESVTDAIVEFCLRAVGAREPV